MKTTNNSNTQRIIVVAGSKEIIDDSEKKIELAKNIGRLIMREPNWILLNGGASSLRENNKNTAIDYWAALGAEEEAKTLGFAPEDRIITLHPKESDHPLHSIGKVEVSKRRTPALRRFDLVARADAIITIEGLAGLLTLLELAIALKKPLIPIPCTGGTSLDIWNIYETEIIKALKINKMHPDYIMLLQGLNAHGLLSNTIIRTIKRTIHPICYIITSKKSFSIFTDVIKPLSFNFGLTPIHINELFSYKPINQTLLETIQDSSIIIADITDNDPDIFFQIGIAEALSKPIIIISQQNNHINIHEHPIITRNRSVLFYPPDNIEILQEYLHTHFSMIL